MRGRLRGSDLDVGFCWSALLKEAVGVLLLPAELGLTWFRALTLREVFLARLGCLVLND